MLLQTSPFRSRPTPRPADEDIFNALAVFMCTAFVTSTKLWERASLKSVGFGADLIWLTVLITVFKDSLTI